MDWDFSAFKYRFRGIFLFIRYCIEPKALHPQGEAFIFWKYEFEYFITNSVFNLFQISKYATINFNYSLFLFASPKAFVSQGEAFIFQEPLSQLFQLYLSEGFVNIKIAFRNQNRFPFFIYFIATFQDFPETLIFIGTPCTPRSVAN